MGYGYRLIINRSGVWLMLNGRMFSVYRGVSDRKWRVSVWDNAWRKSGVKIG